MIHFIPLVALSGLFMLNAWPEDRRTNDFQGSRHMVARAMIAYHEAAVRTVAAAADPQASIARVEPVLVAGRVPGRFRACAANGVVASFLDPDAGTGFGRGAGLYREIRRILGGPDDPDAASPVSGGPPGLGVARAGQFHGRWPGEGAGFGQLPCTDLDSRPGAVVLVSPAV